MAEHTKLWYLQNFNLLKEVEDHTLIEMAVHSHMSQTRKKEIIYFPDEPSNTVYLVKSGKIKISRISSDGQTITLALLGPGEIFGESAILGQETRQNIAEVVEDALICAIDKVHFQDLLQKSNVLTVKVQTHIGKRMQEVESKIEDLVFKDARERIITFLKHYINHFGKQLVDLWEVRPFLTHQEIAELTATSRQTVNAILNELKSQGSIDFTRQYLRVGNPDELA